MKFALVVCAVLATAFAIGCIGQGGPDETGAKDCGTDLACIKASWGACEKAKVRTTQEVEGITLKMYGLVKGGTSDACSVYLKVEDIIVPENAPLEQKLGAETLIKGKDMTCVAPVDQDVMALSVDDLSKCSGSLADSINTIRGITGK
ncbi:MAG: hypothetical protein QXO69_03395 [archaeon]